MSKAKEHNGRRERGIRITVEMVAFTILAVYIVGYTISMAKKPNIGVETVAYGQIDVPRQYDGVILRDETVTYANEAGTVFFSYGENEYVKKGDIVCVIKDGEEVVAYEREIEAINDDILNRQASFANAAQSEEVNRLNSKIRTEINKTIPLFLAGKANEVYRLKNTLQKDIETRNDLVLSSAGEALSTLVDRRSAYETKLSDAIGVYTANEGGILSYGTDGLESVLSPESIMSVTREQLEEPSVLGSMSERQVERGSPLYKIVKSNTWYMCTYLDNELALDWEKDSGKPIYFNNENAITKISMKINEIEPKDGKTYVVFSSSKYMPDFINERHVKFRLEEDTYNGLKIPNTAIVAKTALTLPGEYIYEYRGQQGVYVKESNGGFAFKAVNVLSMRGGEACILQNFAGIKLNDTVYLYEDGKADESSGFTLEKIVTTEGIYVANSGTAEFRQIDVLVKNEYYAIIEKSTAVKAYDTIITDASSVSDNQIIR